MKRVGAALVVMLLSTAISVTGDQDAERMLKAAMNTEVVDGNMKTAIDQYKHIVDVYGKTDRVTAARALLRLAEAYQKLGDAQAAPTYQRLLREFGDQAEAAAIARSRLGSSESVAARRGDRAVWTGTDADGFGTISPDGRFLTYTQWRSGGRLMLRDLGTGTERPLTDSNEGSTQFSVISKNGKEVAYQWFPFPRPSGPAPELRISSLEAGNNTLRRLQFSEDLGGVAPFDWSADGKWLAVQVSRKDRSNQIGLVAVQDGALRVLKSTDWQEPTKIFFSPDGRYIAYDLPVSETSDERHVYVMATDGSVESEAVRHQSSNVAMGWSRDHLLFSSNRGGATGLWAVPMSSGKALGAPSLVQTDIASSWSLGTSSDGTVYTWRDRRGLSVQTAQVDLAAGKLLPSDRSEQFIRSRGRPEWSPDGKQIAYHSCNGLGGGPCTVLIWTLESGTARELPTRVRYQQGFRWSPDGRFLLAIGSDFKQRRAVFRIDPQTGDSSVLMNIEDTQVPPHVEWAADARSVYYRQRSSPGSLVVVKRDLTSGAEQVVLRAPADNARFVLSRANGSIAFSARNDSARTVHIASLPGGESRLVLQATDPEEIYPVAWTPDDRALLIVKSNKGILSGLWLVPVDGTQPRKIDGDVTSWTYDGGVRLSPDGTRVTFVRAAGQPGNEIWAFDSYLSALNARRESKR